MLLGLLLIRESILGIYGVKQLWAVFLLERGVLYNMGLNSYRLFFVA